MPGFDVDVAVVGGGCAGLAVAFAAAERDLSVCLFEKEHHLAAHQSGRNSGVLHPGFTAPPNTERAELARVGARRTAAFCREHGVPLRETGFLFAALDEDDAARLSALEERAVENDVAVRLLRGAAAVKEVEPGTAAQAGLYCPSVQTVDSSAYVGELAAAGDRRGVDRRMGRAVTGIADEGEVTRVQTEDGDVTARHVVNAAGVHAGRLAASMGVPLDCRIVPFRGAYYELTPGYRDAVETVVYPVPDPDLPFLGAHYMPLPDGRVLVGPTTSLAFGPEAYDLSGVDPRAVLETLTYPGFHRLLRTPGVLRNAVSEFSKALLKRRFVADARRLVPAVDGSVVERSFVGVSAQVVDHEGRLVPGPVVRHQANATHVLDPVSLTAALEFGDRLADDLAATLA